MSRNHFPEVHKEFTRYTILLSDFKTVDTNPLQTVESKGGHNLEIVKTGLTHPDPFRELELEIRFKPAWAFDYEFKIFWREVEKGRPVFRFETWGDGHNNPERGAGLPARKIPTPHFHRIESDGKMWAYRPPSLDQPGQDEAVRTDYSVGVKQFCQEAKIHDSNGADVIVNTLSQPLGVSISTDKLNGVSFK